MRNKQTLEKWGLILNRYFTKERLRMDSVVEYLPNMNKAQDSISSTTTNKKKIHKIINPDTKHICMSILYINKYHIAKHSAHACYSRLRRWRQEDHKFEVILDYIQVPDQPWAT
jgi:hypothetical protein